MAFGDTEGVPVPQLIGQSVRGVTEACSRLGLVPLLVGSGVALEQSPEAGDARRARQPRQGAIRARHGRSRRGAGARVGEMSIEPGEGRSRLGRTSARHARPAGAGMRLNEVFAGAEVRGVSGPIDVEILSIACDSRKVTPGAFFSHCTARKSTGTHLCPMRCSAAPSRSRANRPRAAVPGEHAPGSSCCRATSAEALARAAANFYGHPAECAEAGRRHGNERKDHDGILVDSILRAAGHDRASAQRATARRKAARVAMNTTPESLDLQQMFAEVRDAGGTHAVLEASSHALAMERLWGCHFAAAVFTNLTRDHLDYHKTFEEYFAAKRRLFEGTGAGAPDVAVINADDPYARGLRAWRGAR